MTNRATPTTVRLDEQHEKMLLDLQRDLPNVSRQRVFEGLIEDAHARREANLAAITASVVKDFQVALDKLRDL